MGYQLMAHEDMRDASEATQRRILVETTIANEKKSVGIAYLLFFLFGGFGGHNFYLGRVGQAALQLIGTLVGWAANFSGQPLLALPIFVIVGFSLLFDLCFIPARVNAHTEKLRERLSDTMIWHET
jgi:TM2 domain-containing membrane protein YozV